MKKILKFEINKKASKVNQQQKHKARGLVGRYYTHAHSTLKHARRAGGSSRKAQAQRQLLTRDIRRKQHAHHQTRLPNRDGSDGTGRFTGSVKKRPVQPVFSGSIAHTVF